MQPPLARPNIFARHPLAAFFALAYLLSWGSFFAMGGPFVFPFGSVVAAVVVAFASEGTAGLKELLRRCFRWRVNAVWYVAAFVMPVAIGLGALYLNVLTGAPRPAFTGAWYEALLLIPMALVDAPLWEDAGWRGFAMPRFSSGRSRIVNTFILGLLLAGWHLPLALSAGAVAAAYVITTVLSAFVTNWIYYHARQSALLAMLYHATANALGITFFQTYTGDDQVKLFWLLAATNLLAAAIVILASRRMWFGTDPDAEAYD